MAAAVQAPAVAKALAMAGKAWEVAVKVKDREIMCGDQAEH
jgi:hypothetical protein